MAYIEINNLSFSYGKNSTLKDISFQINKCDSFGIIGPNGSGKTTLLRLISGYYPYTSGEILYENKQLKKHSKKELARSFAFVEQEGIPSVKFTVEEVISMGRFPWIRPFSKGSPRDSEMIEKALSIFDIKESRGKPVDSLSGGERQLVSLAKAFVQEPQVLILDEPTTYLDLGHQSLIMHYIRKWQREDKLTIIMVLHDLNLAAQFCDRLALLNDGEIKSIGKVEEVLQVKNIESAYKTRPILIEHPETKLPQILLSS